MSSSSKTCFGHLVTNDECVVCPICGESMVIIDCSHLKRHKISLKKFRTLYPAFPTITLHKANLIKARAINKRRQTCLDRHGVNNPAQLETSKTRMKQTWEERYGGAPLCNKKVMERKKHTCQTKYGFDHSSKCEAVQNKRRKTFEKRYGGHPLSNEEVKKKIRDTCLKRYGGVKPSQSTEVKRKMSQTLQERFASKRVPEFHERVHKVLDVLGFELCDPTFLGSQKAHNFKCKKCGGIFRRKWNYIQQGWNNCPYCSPKRYGHSQNEVSLFLQSLGLVIHSNSRSVIPPLELDIVIPNSKVAIEFDGLFWHSEDQLINNRDIDPKFYHLHKTEACEKAGYRLIHIFEDEWVFKQDIVKHRLKSILGLFDGIRIHARECEVREIDAKTKNEFLETYHIQGQDRSKIKLGAFHGNQLVAVMTFSVGNISKGSKSEPDVWELSRFCVDYHYHIPGIAGKLLSYFQPHYSWSKIYSYADRRWSNGNLYKQLGFEFDKYTPVNYWYCRNYQRIHRFNLRKRPDEPKDVSEWVLRAKEGYWKVWDCGNLKYVLRR